MAKILFSAVVGDARKKIGGVVFTKGRTGAVVRRKVSPTQPRTQDQRNVRASFSALSKNWATAAATGLGAPAAKIGATLGTTLSGLTPTQRAGWVALANAFTRKDQFGNTKILTGLQIYQSCNRNLESIAAGSISDAPANLDAGSPGTLTVTATAGTTPALTVDADTEPATAEAAAVYAAAQVSPGRVFIGKRYRLIFTATPGTAGPYDVLTAYTSKFGALVAGKQLPLLLAYINSTTGAKGQPSAATQLVGAGS